MNDFDNRFLKKLNSRANLSNSHRRAPKQEEKLSIRFKGVKTPASGSREIKGDVKVPKLLRIEAKTTKNASFSVTLDMVRKIEEAALSSGEMPAIVVEFNDGFGRALKEIAIVPMYVLDKLCEK